MHTKLITQSSWKMDSAPPYTNMCQIAPRPNGRERPRLKVHKLKQRPLEKLIVVGVGGEDGPHLASHELF